ncbi:OSBP family protein [Abortiporus biennis]
MAPNDEHNNNGSEEPFDEDAPGQAISVPDAGDTGDSGKLKMIVQLVKKCLGVKDIAAMRLSLPASLLEPIPNLEYWHYLDRPDLFAAINDSDDPFQRMLAVLRFTFSKDLKFIRGKVCKPYNSVLGEHFRSHWDVLPVSYHPSDPHHPPIQHLYLSEAAAESTYSTASLSAVPAGTRISASETASIKSGKSTKSGMSSLSFLSKAYSSPSTPGGKDTPATSPSLFEADLDAQISSLSLSNADASTSSELLEADSPSSSTENTSDIPSKRVRVVYLTEQVSHHPPVSAFTAACPSRHLELTGIDQISAKVSGTTVRVMPGSFNKGFFVKVTGGHGNGEVYQVTHPVASVNGILRGSFYVTVSESTIITCTGPPGKDGKPTEYLRAIIEYKEESWLGRAHFLCEGVIHTYVPGETAHEEWTKVKHVPRSRVVATFDGSWKHMIRWKRVQPYPFSPSSSSLASTSNTAKQDEYSTLIDISTLHVIPKQVRPLSKQLPNESRKLWENVTTKLLAKEYGDATKHKHIIEQKQRDDAAERKKKGVQFTPRYFEPDLSTGIPILTEEGHKALLEETKEESLHPLEDVPSVFGQIPVKAEDEPSSS